MGPRESRQVRRFALPARTTGLRHCHARGSKRKPPGNLPAPPRDAGRRAGLDPAGRAQEPLPSGACICRNLGTNFPGPERAMIFRQLFDNVSSTYSYLIASRRGGEALILDPVLEKVDRYIQLVKELDLKLVKAVDTHVHADHITGLGALRDRTHCITVMGEHSKVDVVSMRVADGDQLQIEGLSLDVLYTPGHTDDSYSFLLGDRVFTGDTLLIRGTGRTDFQNGDPRAQYDSIFNKLLKLPDETLMFPAHDYKGDTVSTIGEEKFYNPRLQVKSVDEYVALMGSLNRPNPKMMDVAVPANMRVGLAQEEIARRGWAIKADEAVRLIGQPEVALVDLREP